MSKPFTLDDLHGDVIVASVILTLSRLGNMSIAGTITDETYILGMLETAVDYLHKQQARRELIDGSKIIIPSYDTALHRTPEEAKLIAARDEISNVMAGM